MSDRRLGGAEPHGSRCPPLPVGGGRVRTNRVGFDLENLVKKSNPLPSKGADSVSLPDDLLQRPTSSSILKMEAGSDGRATTLLLNEPLARLLQSDSRRVVGSHTTTPSVGESTLQLLSGLESNRRCITSGRLPSFIEGVSSATPEIHCATIPSLSPGCYPTPPSNSFALEEGAVAANPADASKRTVRRRSASSFGSESTSHTGRRHSASGNRGPQRSSIASASSKGTSRRPFSGGAHSKGSARWVHHSSSSPSSRPSTIESATSNRGKTRGVTKKRQSKTRVPTRGSSQSSSRALSARPSQGGSIRPKKSSGRRQSPRARPGSSKDFRRPLSGRSQSSSVESSSRPTPLHSRLRQRHVVTPPRLSRSSNASKRLPVSTTPSTRPAARAPKLHGKKAVRKNVDITALCLNSINYTALRSAIPKQRKVKMISEFVGAYQRGIHMMEADYTAELAACEELMSRELFKPQQKEIIRMAEFIKYLRRDCKEKLDFASNVVNNVLDGVEDLIKQARTEGMELCRSTNIYAESVLYDDPNVAKGVPMPEVRGADDMLKDDHPRIRFINEEETQQMKRSAHFFSSTLEVLHRDALSFDVNYPVASMEHEHMSNYFSMLEEELQAYKASRAREAYTVKARLDITAASISNMIRRLNRRDEDNRTKLKAMQRALDEGATQRKLTKDFLVGTIENAAIETQSSLGIVRELNHDLRVRMDTIEGNIKLTLDELLLASADLCVEHRPYNTTVMQMKEDAMFQFTSKMERSVIEQAELLREAKTVMTNLWRTRFIAGREEKTTLFYQSVPSDYEELLKECDRDTLIRLVHHLSLQSTEMAHCLMGALDEYQYYLQENPTEARKVKDDAEELRVVMALLKKLKEEKSIQSNPHRVRNSLVDSVQDIINNYNAYVTFNEKHARVQARLHEESAQPSRPAFFDSGTTLLPPAQKAAATNRPPAKSASSASLHSSIRPPMPPSTISVPQTLSVLSKTHPSGPSGPSARTSVVGDGRWHGLAAAVPDGVESDASAQQSGCMDVFVQVTPSYRKKSRLPMQWNRQPSPLTVAMEVQLQGGMPPPGLPLRTQLAAHVVKEYSSGMLDGGVAHV